MKPVIIGNATRIYALCEFPSQEPRYVGKTVQSLRHRMNGHMRIAKRSPRLPVHRWLSKRAKENKQVCIKWIETVAPGGDWQARERYWINTLRREGADLLNLTEGGEGLAGHVFSDEHKAKISAALRTGAECSCLHCGTMFWRKKNQIQKGQDKYCSKGCYQAAQVGKPKASVVPATAIEAAAKARRAQTTCKRGHPLSGTNLFITSGGARGCKECRKIHKAKYLSGLK